jgi:hypothetical protein
MAMHAHRVPSFLGALLLSVVMAAPALGQEEPAPVPYLDAQGIELGSIIIREIADPFTGFDPASPPAEGQRYVLLTATFEAAEDQSFPTDPYQVQLLDTNGVLYYPTWVPRPAEDALPDLQSQNLAPYDRVSGAIGYVVPADAALSRIVYRGDGSRLMTLAELGEAGAVALGEPRTISSREGTALGSVTLRGFTDPFTEFDPVSVPPEGQRFVGLDVAFEAASDQAMWAYPASVMIMGSDGVLYWPTWVPRPQPYLLQDAQATPLSPGDRISGFVGYALPEGVTPDLVFYAPEYDRFLPLADL